MRAAFLLLLSLSLAGCFEPKIDGTDKDAYKASVEKIGASLTPDQKAVFQKDLMVVAMQGLSLADLMKSPGGADAVLNESIKKLDGKTAADVTAEANRIRLEREAKEKVQALAEIKELLEKRVAAEAAKSDLSKFAVSRSRFYIDIGEYSFQNKPVIELHVENGTSKAVSRAYFRGTIATPGRSVPWVVETFNYEIPGGLEPGEQADWSLLPNKYGKFGEANVPAGAVFTVEVTRLDDAQGKPMYDSEGFTDREQARLDTLQSKYPAQ